MIENLQRMSQLISLAIQFDLLNSTLASGDTDSAYSKLADIFDKDKLAEFDVIESETERMEKIKQFCTLAILKTVAGINRLSVLSQGNAILNVAENDDPPELKNLLISLALEITGDRLELNKSVEVYEKIIAGEISTEKELLTYIGKG
ncbi:hypothetical protein ABGV42_01265 [Paenibacillus pabuli]|uniref:hypothetical protein n=1 Tax=Paenibacillus pabuli TaxID=1472 RepID=UPI003242337B